jgi:hypothetical protein
VTVLFGGYNGNTANGETWEWDGSAWTQRVVSGPSPRRGHAMAYDVSRGVTVLFGGTTGASNGETWEWNGTAWTQQTITGPAPRVLHAMAYDAARGLTVLFGGVTTESFHFSGETWGLGVPCTAPAITAQPAAQTVCAAGSASFAVTAAGTGPLAYEWQIQHTDGQWATLGNDPGPIACPGGGSGFAFATPLFGNPVTIGVHGCQGVQHWPIRCIVSNPCGSVTSDETTLTICPADFNCDGSRNSQDFFDFLGAFFAGTPDADFNGDGTINSQDFFDFISVFFAGC